jgi:transcriptional regulator with XRE-family HTH domain
MKIGENIRHWRELKNMKQEDLAKKLKISKANLSNIENDINKPNIDMLESIANSLEIEVNQLFLDPKQLFTFNNCTNSYGVYGTQHNNNMDKVLIERLINLMEKVTTYFMNDKK